MYNKEIEGIMATLTEIKDMKDGGDCAALIASAGDAIDKLAGEKADATEIKLPMSPKKPMMGKGKKLFMN